jgi:hypothetical protein
MAPETAERTVGEWKRKKKEKEEEETIGGSMLISSAKRRRSAFISGDSAISVSWR